MYIILSQLGFINKLVSYGDEESTRKLNRMVSI